jgi:hypothetical protein
MLGLLEAQHVLARELLQDVAGPAIHRLVDVGPGPDPPRSPTADRPAGDRRRRRRFSLGALKRHDRPRAARDGEGATDDVGGRLWIRASVRLCFPLLLSRRRFAAAPLVNPLARSPSERRRRARRPASFSFLSEQAQDRRRSTGWRSTAPGCPAAAWFAATAAWRFPWPGRRRPGCPRRRRGCLAACRRRSGGCPGRSSWCPARPACWSRCPGPC